MAWDHRAYMSHILHSVCNMVNLMRCQPYIPYIGTLLPSELRSKKLILLLRMKRRRLDLRHGKCSIACSLKAILTDGCVVQWVACLKINHSVVSLNPIKGSCCLLQLETLPKLLSNGWFQQCIQPWFHNRTKWNIGPYHVRCTFINYNYSDFFLLFF